MRIEHVPFAVTDWDHVPRTSHPGTSGVATWRTIEEGNIRIRMVEYSPGYVADHWCSKGHVILVLDGELVTEMQNGERHTMTAGQSYRVSDAQTPHRSTTTAGATLFIVD